MRTILMLLAIGGLTAWASPALAQDCCAGCGCQCHCRKICRLVCETKKVPKTTYSCKCEDFCLPGKSQKCGTVCEPDCQGCPRCKTNWTPTSDGVFSRTKLVKTVTEKEEKTYKWVVEYVCDKCATCPESAGPPAPQPPQQVWLRPITSLWSR